MWDVLTNITARLSNLIIGGAVQMTDKQFLEKEIARWKRSPERMMQIKSFLYYNDDHDILHRKRQMIGEDGKLEDVENLPNNHIIDNQYGKLVNQKANYLLGQPFTVDSENDQYAELLFLSTPSVRRATLLKGQSKTAFLFLSTPSGRRATAFFPKCRNGAIFLSTPSVRRAT